MAERASFAVFLACGSKWKRAHFQISADADSQHRQRRVHDQLVEEIDALMAARQYVSLFESAKGGESALGRMLAARQNAVPKGIELALLAARRTSVRDNIRVTAQFRLIWAVAVIALLAAGVGGEREPALVPSLEKTAIHGPHNGDVRLVEIQFKSSRGLAEIPFRSNCRRSRGLDSTLHRTSEHCR